MPPQIKQDLNRSGWETTDFPSVCESCLPDNPYVQMLKNDYGAECKLCTRPFTVFTWKPDRTSRNKRTNVCLTCARLKNCCQCCMLDLSFGLPLVVRDAALKMVAPGPSSEINREYYAQVHEKELEEGRGAVKEYEKTDEKARDLLRRLATSGPYYRKPKPLEGAEASASDAASAGGVGPIRTRDSTVGPGTRGGRGGARGVRQGAARLPGPNDIRPPADRTITSLFVTGVDDDLPEYKIREFFAPYGKLRSIVCAHASHCAFVNYLDRASAEKAAEALQGRAIVAGCPLRVQWGKPRPIGNLEKEEASEAARDGRSAFSPAERAAARADVVEATGKGKRPVRDDLSNLTAIAPPPGSGEVQYASLSGN